MTNGRVEVITSVERRRRWSSAEKEQLVAAALEPGASVSSVILSMNIFAVAPLESRQRQAGAGRCRFIAARRDD